MLATSFERIHRSNLIGMSVLPLQFTARAVGQSLGLTGEEVYSDHRSDRQRSVGTTAAPGHGAGRDGGNRRRNSRRPCGSIRRPRPPTTATAESCNTCCDNCSAKIPSKELRESEAVQPMTRRAAAPDLHSENGTQQAAASYLGSGSPSPEMDVQVERGYLSRHRWARRWPRAGAPRCVC